MARKRTWGKRGQSIIEYLVVVAAVIIAIIAIGGLVTPAVIDLGTDATGRLDAAGTALGTIGANPH